LLARAQHRQKSLANGTKRVAMMRTNHVTRIGRAIPLLAFALIGLFAAGLWS
jgi:hypothetical protein